MATDDIQLRQGDSYLWELEFVENDQPIDITGRTIIFTVKADLDDADNRALFQVVTTFADNENSHNGLGTLFISSANTSTLVAGDLVYYDIQESYLDGNGRLRVNTLAYDTFTVLPQVTRTALPTP